MVITAISGLIYSFARIQREYISPVFYDVLLAITLVSTTFLIVAIVNRFTVRILEKSSKQVPSDLLRLTLSAALFTICGILILKFVYGKDVTALLATAAVLTVALGWGLRRPVEHLFSGLTLELERPLVVGDHIKFDDQSGQVEALKWRALYVRTKDDSLIIIPNSRLADSTVELFPLNEVCRHYVDVGIPNDVPPSKVLAAATEVISDQLPFVENYRDSSVQINGLDSTSGTISYRIHYYTSEFFRVEDINTEILERLWYALTRNGIDMSGLNQNLRFSQLLRGYQGGDSEQAMRFESRVNFLRTIEAFRDLSRESVNSLVQQLVPNVYAAGETIKIHKQRPGSLFIVQTGRVSVQYSGANYFLKHENTEKTADSLALYPDASHWDRLVLQEVTENATYYLGPVAQQLVEREARYTLDPYDLHHRLAEYINDKAEREQFLAQGPDAHVQVLLAGDGLCSILGFEEKLGKPRVVALQETELLELPGANAKVLKAGGDSLGQALDAYIEQMQSRAVSQNRLAHIEGFTTPATPCHAG